jgi:hypothetical protein
MTYIPTYLLTVSKVQKFTFGYAYRKRSHLQFKNVFSEFPFFV